jgi:hypothetical protein
VYYRSYLRERCIHFQLAKTIAVTATVITQKIQKNPLTLKPDFGAAEFPKLKNWVPKIVATVVIGRKNSVTMAIVSMLLLPRVMSWLSAWLTRFACWKMLLGMIAYKLITLRRNEGRSKERTGNM